MKTQVKKVGDTLVVVMDGELDFEMQDPIKEHLKVLAKQLKTDVVPKKVIFNFENLEFVGSCGISSFIQSLKDFQTDSRVKPHFCNVKSEFRRLMHIYGEETDTFEFYENEERVGEWVVRKKSASVSFILKSLRREILSPENPSLDSFHNHKLKSTDPDGYVNPRDDFF